MSSGSEVIILGFWHSLKPSYCFRPGLIKTGCADAYGWGRPMFCSPTLLIKRSGLIRNEGVSMQLLPCLLFKGRSPSFQHSLTLAWLKQSNSAVFVADCLITIYNIIREENLCIGWKKWLSGLKRMCWRSLQLCNTSNNNNNNNNAIIRTMHTNRAGTIKQTLLTLNDMVVPPHPWLSAFPLPLYGPV